MIVWEYICDENNNIITVQQWKQSEKPEFKDNPKPNQNILKGKLIDKWGNHLYKYKNNQITENIIKLDDKQKKLEKLSTRNILDVIRIMLQGMEDPNDEEYLEFKSEILG